MTINTCYAHLPGSVKHPFYIGFMGGYGSTTWNGLVPTKSNQNAAVTISTPVTVSEGGATWGALFGYQFTPHFALEGTYTQYPRASISFDEFSLFTFDHEGLKQFFTDTETVNLMAKFMLIVPETNLRVFSSLGAAGIHRNDIVVNGWMLSPTFGFGVNVLFDDRLMGELTGNYTTGYGESRLSPADSFYPFLFSLTLRIAYLFG